MLESVVENRRNAIAITKKQRYSMDQWRLLAMSRLDYLIERAREYRKQNGFSQEEQDRQVRSFAYGNTRLENDSITMDGIDRAMRTVTTERDRTEPASRT
jgi:hypothetical protein